MITLNFKSIEFENFQSLGKGSLNLNDLGLCLIQGINNYDNMTKSNGSGKSSLMSTIIWCLFGQTPTGIKGDVVNKFSKGGCYVKLILDVDNVEYTIIRSQKHKEYKTGLIVYKNGEDISARNKTDSDKVIKDVLQIDKDIFLQLIYLSQGFSDRFAIYTPKNRKELLEELYNVNENLDYFVNLLKDKLSTINDDYTNNSTLLIKTNSNIENISNNIASTQNSIDYNLLKIKQIKEDNTNIDINEIKKLENNINENIQQKDTLKEKLHKIDLEISKLNVEKNQILDKNNNLKNEKNKFSNNKVCPTCGTILEDYENNEHIQLHLKEIDDNININQNKIDEISKKLFAFQEKRDIIKSNKLNSIENNILKYQKELNVLNEQYKKQVEKDANVLALKNQIKEQKENIQELNNKLEQLNIDVIKYEKVKIELSETKTILEHMIRLANNQFKSYLLDVIIKSLNEILKELSLNLFENEIIQIEGDNKLDIKLININDDKLFKYYEQLSGGEQRKCDISIIIAQRRLAQKMNSIYSNVLIADEIFDGLDEVSFNIVLDLLSNEMQDVESMFIISHRDIKEIPFDTLISVIKNKNQISEISYN